MMSSDPSTAMTAMTTAALGLVLAGIAPIPGAEAYPTIVSGGTHTCALTGDGTAKCWGHGLYGQLGNGSKSDRVRPIDVAGLGTGVRSIALGNVHTCAVTSGGAAKCWGYNRHGQLGDGTTSELSLVPVQVVGLESGVASVASNGIYTCALITGGAVQCWGSRPYVQQVDRTPVAIAGLQGGVVAITAGGSHTCALTGAGAAKCWGLNYYGQLGDGTMRHSETPVTVSGLESGVVAISAGFSHTCALTRDGATKCWGLNNEGQVGDGSQVFARVRPFAVGTLSSNVTAISAGENYNCALSIGKGAKCWGANYEGALGDGTTNERRSPVFVSGLKGVAVSAGSRTSCALIETGFAKCWGDNYYGQLGDGTRQDRLTPVFVKDFRF